MYGVCVCVNQFLFISHNSERSIPFKLKPFIALLPVLMYEYQSHHVFGCLPSISCNIATFPFRPSRNLLISVSNVFWSVKKQ